MNLIWCFFPWLPYQVGLDKLVKHCAFLNSQQVFEARGNWQDFPIAQLKLTLDDFDVDCFVWESYILVSERMRRAMALNPSQVQFFDVDGSCSAPLPRSKNYQIMTVPAIEDVSDTLNSEYSLTRFGPDSPEIPVAVNRIAIRPNVHPTYELFHDVFFRGHMFCTDAFAIRVLRAGCTGVRFFDPAVAFTGKRYRTLRGIEEEVDWDPVRKIAHAKLVEAIH